MFSLAYCDEQTAPTQIAVKVSMQATIANTLITNHYLSVLSFRFSKQLRGFKGSL